MTPKCEKPNCVKPSKRLKKCRACTKQFHTACGEFSTYKDRNKADEIVHLCSTCSAIPAITSSLTLRYHTRSGSASSTQSSKRKALEIGDSESSDEEEPDLRDILIAVKKGTRNTETLVKGLQKEVEDFNSNLTTRCDELDEKFRLLQADFNQFKESHTKEIEALQEKNDYLEFKMKTEAYIHGHASSGAADLDINAAVIQVAEFLDVTITDRDIQRVRIVKRRDNSFAAVTRPPIIAVEFWIRPFDLLTPRSATENYSTATSSRPPTLARLQYPSP